MGKERVKVIARVRPLTSTFENEEPSVTCTDEQCLQVSLSNGLLKRTGRDSSHSNSTTTTTFRQHSSQRVDAKSFRFDRTFGPEVTQAELAERIGLADLVQSAIDGYSITIFAFGQTGAGKTHTLAGPPDSINSLRRQGGKEAGEEAGIVPRAILEAFKIIDKGKREGGGGGANEVIKPKVSICEIYSEQVTDLLRPKDTYAGVGVSQILGVRHDKNRGFYVEGLTQQECNGTDDALKAFGKGFSERRLGSHNLNAASNRSHCIMTLDLETRGGGGGGGGGNRYGKVVFVDLAGSERLKVSGSSGEAAKETGFINRSLFILGKVICALGGRNKNNRKGNNFVPYRESKLTQLLIDGLHGKGRALMMACCSPEAMHAEETTNTLHFASMALNITAEPVMILDPQERMLQDMKNTIKSLREENKTLTMKLERALSMGGGGGGGGEGENEAQEEEERSVPSSSSSGGSNSLFGNTYEPINYDFKPFSNQGTAHHHSSSSSPSSSKGAGKVAPLTIAAYATPAPSFALKKTSSSSSPNSKARTKSSTVTQYIGGEGRGEGSGLLHYSGGGGGDENIDLVDFREEEEEEEEDFAMAFPGLAALEAQFQQNLKIARGEIDLEDDDLKSPSGSSTTQVAPPHLSSGCGREEEDHLAQYDLPPPESTSANDGEGGGGGVVPDKQATSWADRNVWFGSDMEMTQAAYDIHDALIAKGVDANSNDYYAQLSRSIATKFPEKAYLIWHPRRRTTHGNTDVREEEQRLIEEMRAMKPKYSRLLPRASSLMYPRNGPTKAVSDTLKAVSNNLGYGTSFGGMGQIADTKSSWSLGGIQGSGVFQQGSYNSSSSSRRKGPIPPSLNHTRPWDSSSTSSGARKGSTRSKKTAVDDLPLIVLDRGAFLERREQIIEQLRDAKMNAEAEHRQIMKRISSVL